MSDRDNPPDGFGKDLQDQSGPYSYPEEFGYLTIGVPINADMAKVWPLRRAFNPQKLSNKGLLVATSPTGEYELTAGASDSKTQDTTGWTASGSIALNFGIADFSAKFYLQQQKNACELSTKATLVGRNVKTCQLNLLDDHDTTKWYSCTTEDFRKKYQAVSKAAINAVGSGGDNASHIRELTLALLDFYVTFGTGFVDSLDLIAYGIVEGSWERKTRSATDDFIGGGGIAASLPFVGGAAEGEYVKTHADNTVMTHLTVRAFGRSGNSPQYQWALDKAAQLDGQSLEKFLNGQAWTQEPTTKVATYANPKLEYKPKDLTEIPVPELPGALGIFSKALNALKAITVKNVKIDEPQPEPQATAAAPAADPAAATAPPADPDSALAAQTEKKVATLRIRAAYDETQINKVGFTAKVDVGQPAKPAADQTEKPAAATPEKSSAATSVEQPAAPSTENGGTPPSSDSGATSGDDGLTGLELGDYVVCGYSYRPWEEVFPKLKLALECTPAQVVFGQALVWYSMREMFAQYLDFCAKFDGVSRHQDGSTLDIGTQAERFRTALDSVGDYMTQELTGELTIDMITGDTGNTTSKTDLNFVQKLEDRLSIALRPKFSMYKHYKFWLDNYDWLKLAPFGVVAVIERSGKLYYQQNPYPGNPMRHSEQPEGCAPVPGRDPSELIKANAYRLYPILSTSAKDEPHFVWVGAPTPLTGDNDDAGVRYSGRFSLNQRSPGDTPVAKSKQFERKRLPADPPWAQPSGDFHIVPEIRLEEVALPMLIHQSKAAAEEIARSEEEFNGARDPMTGEDVLTERWTNRKRVFGMHLYPGVGDDDCFGHIFPGVGQDIGGHQARARLRKIAGDLAHDASGSDAARVLPKLPKTDRVLAATDGAGNEADEEPQLPLWELEEPAGVWGAYFAKRDVTFFWGPQDGPGWDLFTKCPVKFIPIDYDDAEVAMRHARKEVEEGNTAALAWAEAGGGAMWRKPRPELMQRLKKLSGKSDNEAL